MDVSYDFGAHGSKGASETLLRRFCLSTSFTGDEIERKKKFFFLDKEKSLKLEMSKIIEAK